MSRLSLALLTLALVSLVSCKSSSKKGLPKNLPTVSKVSLPTQPHTLLVLYTKIMLELRKMNALGRENDFSLFLVLVTQQNLWRLDEVWISTRRVVLETKTLKIDLDVGEG